MMSNASKASYAEVNGLGMYHEGHHSEALAERVVTVAMRAVLEQLFESGPMTVPALLRSQWLPLQAVQRVVDSWSSRGCGSSPDPAFASKSGGILHVSRS